MTASGGLGLAEGGDADGEAVGSPPGVGATEADGSGVDVAGGDAVSDGAGVAEGDGNGSVGAGVTSGGGDGEADGSALVVGVGVTSTATATGAPVGMNANVALAIRIAMTTAGPARNAWGPRVSFIDVPELPREPPRDAPSECSSPAGDAAGRGDAVAGVAYGRYGLGGVPLVPPSERVPVGSWQPWHVPRPSILRSRLLPTWFEGRVEAPGNGWFAENVVP